MITPSMTAIGMGAMRRLKSRSARKSTGASVAPVVTHPAAPSTSARFVSLARSLMAAARRDHCCLLTSATASADSSSGAFTSRTRRRSNRSPLLSLS